MFSRVPGVGPRSSIEFLEMRLARGFCQGFRPSDVGLTVACATCGGGCI